MLSEEGPTGRLPLNGLRVVDFGHIVAMPFASQWLAFMGAQVICIESRQRPVNRMRPPYADGNPGVNRSGAFNLLNMSKLSLTVNLREEAGRQIVQDLVRQSDVVTENFSTGTMEKLGLGYRELVRLRPDLVMLSVSAAGRTGPMKDFVGFHAAVLMLSGMASITGYSGGHPRGLGSYFPDPLSGMYGVYALLLALYHRRKTGEGGYIDVAMTEAMMSIMPEPIIDYTMNSQQPERAGNMDRIRAPHGVYPCEGVDAWVAISVGSEAEWRALCRGYPAPRVAGRSSFQRRRLQVAPSGRAGPVDPTLDQGTGSPRNHPGTPGRRSTRRPLAEHPAAAGRPPSP